MRQRLTESLGALRDVYGNVNLRRLQYGAAGSVIGSWANVTALAVFAWTEGGATGVAALGVIRTVPAALLAPFVSVIADRHRRRRVMIVSDVLRGGLLGLAALVAIAGWNYWLVLLIAGLVRITSMVFRPAEGALVPALARTPEELTAANAAANTIDNVGLFVGPAIAGFLLTATSAAGIFILTACTFLWSALMLAWVEADAEPEPREREAGGFRHEFTAGAKEILCEPRLRLIVGLFGAETIVGGAQSVFMVAVAFDLLDVGDSGLGFLYSAAGVGGLLGAAATLLVATPGRAAASFGIALALGGLSLVVVGAWPSFAVALAMLVVMGIGNTATDVAGYTIIQRSASDEVLGRVFGVLQGLAVGAMGLGAIAAPLLISAFGIRGPLIATSAALPVLTVLLWSQLRRADRAGDVPERELALIRGVPIFAPLPAETAELIARRLEPLHVAAGEEIFRAGDHGDRFYVVADGDVEVLLGDEVKVEGPGAWFGEIALLRDVPRTATVRARTDVELLALDRDEFLAAVNGYTSSKHAAESVVAERLGAMSARIGTT